LNNNNLCNLNYYLLTKVLLFLKVFELFRQTVSTLTRTPTGQFLATVNYLDHKVRLWLLISRLKNISDLDDKFFGHFINVLLDINQQMLQLLSHCIFFIRLMRTLISLLITFPVQSFRRVSSDFHLILY